MVNQPASFLEWVGTMMMVAALIAIVVATFVLSWFWYHTYPSAADLANDLRAFSASQPSSLKPEEVVGLLEKRQAAYNEAFRGMFQLFVLSGLVPIFTLLAGYVFGKSQAK